MLHKFKVVSKPHELLDTLPWNDTLAVAVSLETVKNEELISRLNLFCFDEPNRIYGYPLKILARRSFAHMHELNRFIELADESGLILKWLKGSTFRESEKVPQFQYAAVELEIFLVLVVITVCLQTIAIGIVFLERKAHMETRNDIGSSVWRFVEKVINPDRYHLMNNLYDIDSKDQ